ncbi:MAG: UvrB/UvrC motif-containing protein [Planctomycetaceae bacterium]
MLLASKELKFEKAARIRDEIESLKSLKAGLIWKVMHSRKCSMSIPKKLAGLKKC